MSITGILQNFNKKNSKIGEKKGENFGSAIIKIPSENGLKGPCLPHDYPFILIGTTYEKREMERN